MEKKAAVAVVNRGGGGKVKGSLDTLDIFEWKNDTHTKVIYLPLSLA